MLVHTADGANLLLESKHLSFNDAEGGECVRAGYWQVLHSKPRDWPEIPVALLEIASIEAFLR